MRRIRALWRRVGYIWREILAFPLVFICIYKIRYWFYRSTRGVSRLEWEPESDEYYNPQMAITNSRISWNSAFRTERLIRLLNGILELKRLVNDAPGPRSPVLCIGPRNESELMLLRIFGFKNVEGADLASYSPLIRVMDMHDLKYQDSHFDVIFASHSLGKAHDFTRVAREIIRVARPGAYCVFSDSINPAPDDIARTPFSNGLSDLLEPFSGHVGEVFWKDELSPLRFSTIFRIAK